ncbi:MAG: thioredoxin family protein [Steroidobacteraceae bacterium]
MSPRLLLAALLLPALAAAGSGPTVATDNVKARLLSEASSIAPGKPFTVALELDIRDGWHTYWLNPGDSGQATRLGWKLPPGFSAGAIQWTAPHRFEIPPLVNYGYAHHAMHLVEITPPSSLAAGTRLELAAIANWLVCSDICIPESAELSIGLAVGDGAPDAAVAGRFTAARADLPQRPMGSVTAELRANDLLLTLKPDWREVIAHADGASFYPVAEGSIEYAAPQRLSRDGDGLQLSMKPGYSPPKSGPLEGVLVLWQGSGAAALSVPFAIAAPLTIIAGATRTGSPRFARAADAASAASAASVPESSSLATNLLLAMAGGLILNLMPCVFPVLSIKAISLVEQAKKSPGAVRMKGVAFAAGVIASMLTLAAVLLALRAGGQQIGWGFQLQSPVFVTFMCYLLLAVGLNLSGVFEFGGSMAGVGDRLTRGDGLSASFFTGVLTTLVATPCTAPFMATAVGAALTLPAAQSLLIFTALGLGLSLPYLLLSFAPGLRRVLPRPGAWMDTLKQVFAFPMYASAAWLLWVLAREVSELGLAAALAGLVLVGLAAWSFQKSRQALGHSRVVALLTAVIAMAIALFLPTRMDAAPGGAGASHDSPAGSGESAWQSYDAARLQQLVAQGRPVLVNFTAAWCLTCLVNERNAFADREVESVFARKGVVLMKGDWTNREPSITQALASFGRAGVPLYVVYNAQAGNHEPLVLPQLLSADLVRNTFAGLPDR